MKGKRMYLKKNFPYVVSGYVIAVGVFFCAISLIDGAFLDPEPPGSYFLVALSVLFIGTGTYCTYLHSRGKLKKSGKTITQVRKESVKNLKNPAMLAQIALDDKNPDIRKIAEERLEELNT